MQAVPACYSSACESTRTMDEVLVQVIHRRRIAVAAVIVDLMKRLNKRKKRRLWSRSWLLRRDAGKDVLSMLFDELGYEDPASFSNYVRMEESTWDDLLHLITLLIKKKDTVMRQAISPRSRLSATLRFFATGNSFQDLAFATRIAPNTLSQIVLSTCLALIEVLEPIVIKFPEKPSDWESISDKFSINWQFPHCIGALDGKHVVFRPPRKEGSKFRNYKASNSIVLMGLVDAEYKYIFVDIGRNGRMHDSPVFRESPLGKKLYSNSLNLPEPSTLPGTAFEMPYVIVGDDAFPLKLNLMKPYPDRNLTIERRIFNYRLSRARRVVENAFVILANRFRILLNPIPLAVSKVEVITYTCVLLHNYLLTKRCQWYVPSTSKSGNSGVTSELASVCSQGGNRSSAAANIIRDKLCDYLNTVGVVPWQYDSVTAGNY